MTLPSSSTSSANFVRLAMARNSHWAYYLLSLVCIVLAYISGQLPLQVVVQNKIRGGNVESDQVDAFYATLDFGLVDVDLRLGLLLLLAGHLAAGLAILACNSLIHRRPTRWLFTSFSRFRWRRAIWAFVVWTVLMVGVELILYALDPANYVFEFDMNAWLSLLPVILVFIPLQTTVEELIFRGYLLPRIAGATRSPLVGVVVSSVLFAALHLGNPEVAQFGLPVMIVYYMLVGVFLGALTVADAGLELAIGIHAATNIYGAAFVGFEGSVLQLGAPIRISEVDPWAMTAGFAIMMIAFYLLTRRKYRVNLVSSLFVRMQEIRSI